MRTHQWTEHEDSRQATKNDLRDIAAALGCVVTPSMQVPELRQRIRAALDRMASGAVRQLRAAVREALDEREPDCRARGAFFPCIESIEQPGTCCYCTRRMRELGPALRLGTSGRSEAEVWNMPKADGEAVVLTMSISAVEPEECEDNECTGCSWCDREESETKQ